MKVEVEKWYVRRDGALSGMIELSSSAEYPFWDPAHCHSYTKDGAYISGGMAHEYDLISEYAEPRLTVADLPDHALPADEPFDAAMARMSREDEPEPITARPAYTQLAAVLNAALNQAQSGKGSERHTTGDTPFTSQPIMAIERLLDNDTGGHAYQIIKKVQEAQRMTRRGQYDAAVRDLLGAINYSAAMILMIQEIEPEPTAE